MPYRSIAAPAVTDTSKLITSVAIGPLTKSSRLAICDSSRAGRAADRSQHRDQRSQIVRTDIKQWACADLKEKSGIRVPGFGSLNQHKRSSTNWLTDRASVDQLACSLKPATEKRVWCAAHVQSARARLIQH